jgi:hypothetical protein
MTEAKVNDFHVFGRGTVSEFLGDFIVYRSLNPCDRRLPDFSKSAAAVGYMQGSAPRKHEPVYAQLVSNLLEAARRLTYPAARLKRLVFLGDTLMSDATAFRNLCQAGGWEGLAFICSEDLHQPASLLPEWGRTDDQNNIRLYQANRWALLDEFKQLCLNIDFRIDHETVVIVDLDKTAIGGRGRNGVVIEQARQLAVQETADGLLGAGYNRDAFIEAYNTLNKPEFHPFTADNQDYLAYVCLVLGSGRTSLQETMNKVRSGELAFFEQFIARIDACRWELAESLRALHSEFYSLMQAGDPTPFKAFRRSEYRQTASRMGFLPDNSPLSRLLAEEIVITGEVWQAALEWKAAGALIFGLSDKPDEASLPDPEQLERGLLPLHKIETHIVGEAV